MRSKAKPAVSVCDEEPVMPMVSGAFAFKRMERRFADVI